MLTSKLRFRAPIEIRGINPFVFVSATRAAKLKPDWRKPMPVRVQVNGKPDVPWRINMMPTGDGGFFLYLHAQVRTASGTAVGDVVSVTVEFDGRYKGGPSDPMPSWFRDGLGRNLQSAARMGEPATQPEKGNHPLPGPAEIGASPAAQCATRAACACRRQSAVHGKSLGSGPIASNGSP
jgi:hypothetical protein